MYRSSHCGLIFGRPLKALRTSRTYAGGLPCPSIAPDSKLGPPPPLPPPCALLLQLHALGVIPHRTESDRAMRQPEDIHTHGLGAHKCCRFRSSRSPPRKASDMHVCGWTVRHNNISGLIARRTRSGSGRDAHLPPSSLGPICRTRRAFSGSATSACLPAIGMHSQTGETRAAGLWQSPVHAFCWAGGAQTSPAIVSTGRR